MEKSKKKNAFVTVGSGKIKVSAPPVYGIVERLFTKKDPKTRCVGILVTIVVTVALVVGGWFFKGLWGIVIGLGISVIVSLLLYLFLPNGITKEKEIEKF